MVVLVKYEIKEREWKKKKKEREWSGLKNYVEVWTSQTYTLAK